MENDNQRDSGAPDRAVPDGELSDGGSGNGEYIRGSRWYGFERLDVYQIAVEFRIIVKKIIKRLPPGFEDDAQQLDRSSKSTIRNICEGSGEFKPLEKARFYRMSLRSAQESGGTLRLLELDTPPNPLFGQAHTVNFKLIAKLTVLVKSKTNRAG
jgi:four helix bundle protein